MMMTAMTLRFRFARPPAETATTCAALESSGEAACRSLSASGQAACYQVQFRDGVIQDGVFVDGDGPT
jgi:hypothetical protein